MAEKEEPTMDDKIDAILYQQGVLGEALDKIFNAFARQFPDTINAQRKDAEMRQLWGILEQNGLLPKRAQAEEKPEEKAEDEGEEDEEEVEF